MYVMLNNPKATVEEIFSSIGTRNDLELVKLSALIAVLNKQSTIGTLAVI
jgi:hypothetical protein